MTSARRFEWFCRDETGSRGGQRSSRTWCQQAGWLTLALAGWVLASGCSKKTPTAAAPPPPAQPPAVAAAQPEIQPDLPGLNRNLLRWMMGHRHRPKDFEEFAASAGVAIPPPPAGKKYIIRKDMHIVLVDR